VQCLELVQNQISKNLLEIKKDNIEN
jgi:hypothetical protein